MDSLVGEYNQDAKHQQDLLQSDLGVCRTIAAGTHGSGPHLLKTLVTPINSMPDGTCRTLKAQYNNTSAANMVREGTFGATGAICVSLVGMSSNRLEPDAQPIDVANTLCARDYKGPNNYGFNGVIECQKS